MNISPHLRPSRALVLGGGGSTGQAWLVGVLAGLAEAGLDVTDADLVVGTSAGATTAAQVTTGSLPDLVAQALTPVLAAAARGRGPQGSASEHLARFAALIEASTDAAEMRRRVGAAAIERAAAAGDEHQARWRSVVASRLPSDEWPERRLLLTTVDATTGEGVALDRDSGVSLTDAVAASCSSGPAYRVGEQQLVDGGYRRNENADLAAGHDRVLVLSPFSGRTLHPPAWGMQLSAQVDELRESGSLVETVFPSEGSDHLFGPNAMDLSLRPEAARLGHRQSREVGHALAAFWR